MKKEKNNKNKEKRSLKKEGNTLAEILKLEEIFKTGKGDCRPMY